MRSNNICKGVYLTQEAMFIQVRKNPPSDRTSLRSLRNLPQANHPTELTLSMNKYEAKHRINDV